MSDVFYPAAPAFDSEAPINLPRNRAEAEYGSDLLCELLGRLGHDYVFLTPGSSFRAVHDSLVNHTRNHKPQIVLCAHEEIAVAMAHGYAKATGRPSLVFLHDLVGIQHGLMAFYNAWADRQPIVVLGGSGPADPALRRRIDWIHSANTQGELVRNCTKWTDEPATLQAVLDSVARAQRVAASAPAGPTYVSVDVAIQEARIPPGVALPDIHHPRFRPAPPLAAAQHSIEQAADLIVAAEMPMISAGRPSARPEATAPLVEIVELTGAVYKDAHDAVCFPSDHPQNLTGGYGATRETEIIDAVDVLLGVDHVDLNAFLGNYGRQREALSWSAGTGARKTVIDLSLNDLMLEHWSHLNGGISPADVQILADPLYGLRQLIDALKDRARGNPAWARRARERAAEIGRRHAALRARQRAAIADGWDSRPVSVARMIAELWDAVKGRDYLLPTRNYRSWYGGIWPFDGAGRTFSCQLGGGIGYGPGAAVGAALAGRDIGKFNVAILGDGEFTMGPSAVWTAVRYRIPLLIVLHNNTSFGNDEEHQIALAKARKRPVENAWIGQRMVGPEPDYAGLARSYGAHGIGPVREPGDLKAAFREAVEVVESGGVALVDIHTRLN